MLCQLNIKNVALIENTEVCFERGLNVLSGETGSGKSALMEALQLALGTRTDPTLIRQGAEKAHVQAHFDLSQYPALITFLEEKGIAIEDPSAITLSREITIAGKSRGFINHQLVQLQLLKQLGVKLVEIVSQHANHKLFEVDYHREILDLYGNIDLQNFKTLWKEYAKISEGLKILLDQVPSRAREIETCERQIEEIEEASLREGEDEELFEEFSRLSSVEERLKAAEKILNALRQSLAIFSSIKGDSQSLNAKDTSIKEDLQSLSQVQLEIEELTHTFQRYVHRAEVDPQKLDQLDERLSLLNRLKKKYGATVSDIEQHLKEQKKRLEEFHKLDQRIEELTAEQARVNEQLLAAADSLTKARKKAADSLIDKVNMEFSSLHMKKAEFHIEITPQTLSTSGADHIEFYLMPNVGEKLIPIKDGASGGEIARVLLALHLILAGRTGISILIFDEIDANIGGQAARVIGEKLQQLGKNIQVLCITHFPQVARYANHHLQISKSTTKGRTKSQVDVLDKEERELELARMVGD